MTAACPVPRANSRAASKRRASNAATSRRPWRVLAMPQHGIVPDDDHQSISRESLAGPLQRRALVRSVSSGILEHWGMSGLQMIQASQLPCWDEWADLTGVAGRSSVAT